MSHALQVYPDGTLIHQHKVYRCALGRAGIMAAADKREGDGGTPNGAWALRELWYRADRLTLPPSALKTRIIQPNDGWCDDPIHPLYNQPITLPFSASHETLWREDEVYDLLIPLGYNDRPVIPGLGSAIFFHVARPTYEPTAGCVAVSKADFLEILPHIHPDGMMEIHL